MTAIELRGPSLALPLVARYAVAGAMAATARVWVAEVSGAIGEPALRRALSPEDLRYAGAAGSPTEARRRLLSRGGLRVLLGAALDLPPRDVPIVRSPGAAPTVALSGAPVVSVSHSGPWVLWALASAPIGLDVECARPGWIWEDVLEHCFSAEEISRLRRLTGAERDAACLRLWSLKESYLKATGDGLRRDPGSFSIWWPEGTPRLLDESGWSFAELDLGAGTASAIAMESGPKPLALWREE
jgi:4'-phosphopantetheinyl transferase